MKLKKKDIFTIPNILTIFRIVLAFVILLVYWKPGLENRTFWLVAVIALSALTDVLDGKIARKFNMVSEVGKILDPVADKVTAGVLLLCLLQRFPVILPIFILFVIKEASMGIMGVLVLKKTGVNNGALWFGKANTVVFHGIVLLLIFFPNMPEKVAHGLLGVCAVSILLTFLLYMREYYRLLKAKK